MIINLICEDKISVEIKREREEIQLNIIIDIEFEMLIPVEMLM